MPRTPLALLLLSTLLFALSPAHAATLTGFVTDKASGESIGYATVQVRSDSTDAPGPPVATGALTNASGFYSVAGLPGGVYRVTWQQVGHKTVRETLTLGLSDEVRRDIALEVEAVLMEGIEVTADPDEEEAAIQPGFIALDTQQLRRIAAVGERDLIRSLQLLPGIQSASDFSSGLYVRGGGPDQTLILLDQIPLYNPTHAFGFFSTFNDDAIKDVNLYKGAYPAQYGDRLGSVLDVSNRDGNRYSTEGKVSLSVIAARLTVEGPIKDGSWIMAGRRTYLDPFLAIARKSDNQIPDYYFYDLNARVNRNFGASDKVVASGYTGRDDLYLDLDDGNFASIRWGNTAATVKYTHVFDSNLFGNFLGSVSEYESDTEVRFFGTPIAFGNRLLDLSLKGDLDWRANQSHSINTGFWASRYRSEFEQEFNQITQPGFLEQPSSLALYVQDDWARSPRLSLRGGLRGRYFSSGDRWDLEPRISSRYQYRPTVAFKAAAGLYHQYLQLVTTEGFSGGDFWVPTDNTAEPGRSLQSVVGVEWEPKRDHQVTFETYYTDLSDLVQFDNDVSADQVGTSTDDLFKTGGTGFATGFEVFAQRTKGTTTGWLGYALGWSRRQWDDLNQGKEFPPKYDRRHDIKLVVETRRGKWIYGANFIYGTGQAFTPAAARYSLTNPATGQEVDDGIILPGAKNSARLLPFHRLDVSATRAARIFGLEGEWFIQIFNVYNRRNEWFVQYDTNDPTTEPEVAKMLPIIPTVGVNLGF